MAPGRKGSGQDEMDRRSTSGPRAAAVLLKPPPAQAGRPVTPGQVQPYRLDVPHRYANLVASYGALPMRGAVTPHGLRSLGKPLFYVLTRGLQPLNML